VQMLMDQGDVLVNGEREKASLKLRGGRADHCDRRAASCAAEGCRRGHSAGRGLEDADLAVVNKPAGMMVHAGSGQNGGRAQPGAPW